MSIYRVFVHNKDFSHNGFGDDTPTALFPKLKDAEDYAIYMGQCLGYKTQINIDELRLTQNDLVSKLRNSQDTTSKAQDVPVTLKLAF